ncbi:uncharacterized protein STEHIDRAFT_163559 [Stereum hirsutum FP-91666 SS1]|uniref:Uncharacterized protein n=1 Tax=Stereum hirsutum (strain FP-91666) TaxID=721885 RepID=R7RXC2_STEHR|nr:uncharacterized protein STEHIDRAFT_163559 [Stereum hirsutum FP-91666 SS1]EIM79520.1 hypothetical protein STEHIDRAFT_163559 [Stereum hirsutum FP-91666 SS1]
MQKDLTVGMYSLLVTSQGADNDQFDEYDESATSLHGTSDRRRLTFMRTMTLYFSLLINALFLCVIFYLHGQVSDHGLHIYSPAQTVLRPVRRKFSHLLDTNIYMESPSDEVDQAWRDLYNFGISRIPRAQASLMFNKSVPIPGDEENYIISLDVWHQIHCLNMIRQALYPDRYGAMNSTLFLVDLRAPQEMNFEEPLAKVPFDHVAHCINSIRESLICSADITPNVWYWDERVQRSIPSFDVVHECRDFGALKEWALERQLDGEFDTTVHIVH